MSILPALARSMELLSPVFNTELLRLGRRRRTFFMRLGYLILLVGLIALAYRAFEQNVRARVAGGSIVGGVFYSSGLDRGDVGREFTRVAHEFSSRLFWILTFVQAALIVFVTPVVVAGTIVEEKDKRSLELLLATDLTNREIVWGKLGARLVMLGSLLLATHPLLALTQLLGGVESALILSFFAANLCALFATAGIAILFSVQARTLRGAVGWSFLLLLTLFAVWLVPTVALHQFKGSLQADAPGLIPLIETLVIAGSTLSPFALMVQLEREITLGRGFGSGLASFVLLFCGVQLLLGCLAQALATRWLRSAYLRQQIEQVKAAERRRHHPRPAVWERWPLAWKELTAPAGFRLGKWGWLLLVLATITWFAPLLIISAEVWTLDRRDYAVIRQALYPDYFPAFRPGRAISAYGWLLVSLPWFTILPYTLMLVLVTLRGAVGIAGEKDRATWIDLLAAPVSVPSILTAKWLGSLGAVRGLFAYTAGILVVVALVESIAIAWVMLLFFVVTLAFAGQLGLAFSIPAPTALPAAVGAMVALALLGGLPLLANFLLSSARSTADAGALLIFALDFAENVWVIAVGAVVLLIIAKFAPKRLQSWLLRGLTWLAVTVPLLFAALFLLFLFAEFMGLSMRLSELALMLSPPMATLPCFTYVNRGSWNNSIFLAALGTILAIYFTAGLLLWHFNRWRLQKSCGRLDRARKPKRPPWKVVSRPPGGLRLEPPPIKSESLPLD